MKIVKSICCLLIKIGVGSLLTVPIAAMAGIDSGLSDSLRQALEAQGWQAEQAEDGSVIYRQSTVPKNANQTQPVSQNLQGEDLKDSLEKRGWQMDWSPSGSLILKPQSQADKVIEQAKPTAEEEPTDQLPDLPGFEYWRIEKQSDGSLHFHPLEKGSGSASPSIKKITLGSCEGTEIRDARISLPVDQWGEAKALAQGWLNNAGLQDVLVGKIRKVLGVYLISLVEGSPPFPLKHQLAVRASDGRVILLQ